jgi:hypothetical protein
LRRKRAGRSIPRLARPRAPVAARADEVPVGSARLRKRALTVPEQLPRARPHLEEAEVLAVLCGGLEAGLAASDSQCLAAVVPEDVTDRVRGGAGVLRALRSIRARSRAAFALATAREERAAVSLRRASVENRASRRSRGWCSKNRITEALFRIDSTCCVPRAPSEPEEPALATTGVAHRPIAHRAMTRALSGNLRVGDSGKGAPGSGSAIGPGAHVVSVGSSEATGDAQT